MNPLEPLADAVSRRGVRRRKRALTGPQDIHGDALATTAGNLGNRRDPAWVLNLDANPSATILVTGKRREVHARRARGEERERLWARWVEMQPPAKAVAAMAGREIPVFVLTPSGHDAGDAG
jgi:deazaflavin-dependent oxidoreductase (nitroreductase family)